MLLESGLQSILQGSTKILKNRTWPSGPFPWIRREVLLTQIDCERSERYLLDKRSTFYTTKSSCAHGLVPHSRSVSFSLFFSSRYLSPSWNVTDIVRRSSEGSTTLESMYPEMENRKFSCFKLKLGMVWRYFSLDFMLGLSHLEAYWIA